MAITGVRYYTPAPFEVDGNGVPLAGGKLYFYLSGTSTPLDTYSDVNLSVPNANPVEADASGHWASIWLSQTQAYRVVCTDADDVQQWAHDPVGPAASFPSQSVAGIIGEVRAFAGTSDQVPTQWALCYGQAVSRSIYSGLFAVLGTTWGAGNGSTTFNLPDLRGRAMFGVDNMGGSTAGRITAGVSGVAGTTLGASGGSQNAQQDTLTAVSVVTDPGHTHTNNAVRDPTSSPGVGIAGGAVGWTFAAATVNNANTGVTVATTVTSGLTGSSQNVPPAAMINFIIYLGA